MTPDDHGPLTGPAHQLADQLRKHGQFDHGTEVEHDPVLSTKWIASLIVTTEEGLRLRVLIAEDV